MKEGHRFRLSSDLPERNMGDGLEPTLRLIDDSTERNLRTQWALPRLQIEKLSLEEGWFQVTRLRIGAVLAGDSSLASRYLMCLFMECLNRCTCMGGHRFGKKQHIA